MRNLVSPRFVGIGRDITPLEAVRAHLCSDSTNQRRLLFTCMGRSTVELGVRCLNWAAPGDFRTVFWSVQFLDCNWSSASAVTCFRLCSVQCSDLIRSISAFCRGSGVFRPKLHRYGWVSVVEPGDSIVSAGSSANDGLAPTCPYRECSRTILQDEGVRRPRRVHGSGSSRAHTAEAGLVCWKSLVAPLRAVCSPRRRVLVSR